MREILIAVACIILQACGETDTPCGENSAFYEFKNVTICPVSMINLIATPKKYDGKVVLVAGYYARSYELSGLFFRKDDFLNFDRPNALWVGINGDNSLRNLPPETRSTYGSRLIDLVDDKYINGQYVSVVGVFRAGASGHMGKYNGELELMMDLKGTD